MNAFEMLLGLPSMLSGGVITYTLLTIFVTLLLVKFVKMQKKTWLLNQIPGPKSLPIIGGVLELNVKQPELFRRVMALHKVWGFKQSIYLFWQGMKPNLFPINAKTVEMILSSQRHITKSVDYNYLHPWLGTGLVTANGQKWRQRRKLLTPAFHFKILEDFMEVFNQQSTKLVEKLMPEASDPHTFNLFPYVTLCTLDIILESAMGISINAQEKPNSDYVKAIYKMSNLIQARHTQPWLRPAFLFKLFGYEKIQNECLKVLHGMSNKVITDRRAEHINKRNTKEPEEEEEIVGERKRLAFLDLLIESSQDGEYWTNEDLREEVDTFMFEGHDTTAAGINFSVYLLASHPEIQAKVHEELDAIFGDDRERPATMDDLRLMKLLECCIKEALRIFPPVPFLARDLVEDMIIDGYTVPAGTTAIIVPYRLHRDPEQFEDPEHFRPDRFLPENSIKRHPFAYIPFSAGPRNCIGQKFAMMEEKCVISSIFRNFRVETSTKREELRLTGALVLRPEDGNFVTLFKR